jgi:hypothetical protein
MCSTMLPPASSQTSLDIRDVLIAKAHRIRALVPAPLARGRSTAAVAFALGFFLGGGDLRLRLDGAWSDSATTTLKLSLRSICDFSRFSTFKRGSGT